MRATWFQSVGGHGFVFLGAAILVTFTENRHY